MKRLLSIIMLFILIISISISIIPSPTIYKAYNIEIYDKDNNLIREEIKNKYGSYISLNDLNKDTINAFISFEDKNFYKHKGFDFPRIVRSFFTNLFTLSLSQGASTITQQYARTLFLSTQKSIIRKIKEAYYTIKLETQYSKDQILEGYLNSIYLGHGCYGIDAASHYYFNKSSKELTLEESALLAALPSSPSNSSPLNDYDNAIQRRNLVLKSMYKQGHINTSQYNSATQSNININTSTIIHTNIEYYIDQAKEHLKKLNIPLTKGIKLYTNLDTSLYNTVLPLVTKYYSSDTQLSLIILENNTNRILLNIGGFNYQESSYNRSINSKRPIGSTIKTFLYSLALENNFSLETKLTSEKITFHIKDHGTYSPTNSNNIYANKEINMKEAYAVSDNIYATKTLLLLGSDNFIKYLRKFNLYTEDSVPSIALGSSSFTLFDLTKAYSIYANNGYAFNYSFINKIEDSLGNILYTSDNSKKYILSKNIVSQTQELMSLPFYNNNYYTKATLENYNIQNYYGKSGSTNTDSYLILINKNYTIGAWIGTDDYTSLYDYTTTKYLLKDITLQI